MKWQPIAFISIVILNMLGVFHELAHGLAALAYGFTWYGIYIGIPYSYVEISGSNAVVLASGGLVQAGIFAALIWAVLKFQSLRMTFGGKVFYMLAMMIVFMVYALIEVITGV